MKIRVVVISSLLTLILTVSGCTSTVSPVTMPPIQPVGNTSEVEARLIDSSWISPAQVDIGNYYPGAKAEWLIKVHNGNEKATKFAITYRVPSDTKSGYSFPPDEAQDWVIIADTTPIFAAKETREILVTLATPKSALMKGNWEFWVSVIEQGQGNIETEMASRWLVSMR